MKYGLNINVSITNKKGETALLKASEHILADKGSDLSEIVKSLLQRGAKPNKRIFSNIKVGILSKGSWEKKNWDDNSYRKLFVDKYKLKDEILLFKYVKAGKVVQVKKELAKGISINYSDQYSNTALIIACKNNDLKMVEFLVNNDAKINVKNKTDQTPIGLAYSKKNQEMAIFLLKKGWNKLGYDTDLKLLKKAMEQDLLKVVKLLLDKNTHMIKNK